MPTVEPTLLRKVEGPKGAAEIYEIVEDEKTVYEVRFNGSNERFMAMGEAYIEAGAKAGTPL